jgi:hypothetical protein
MLSSFCRHWPFSIAAVIINAQIAIILPCGTMSMHFMHCCNRITVAGCQPHGKYDHIGIIIMLCVRNEFKEAFVLWALHWYLLWIIMQWHCEYWPCCGPCTDCYHVPVSTSSVVILLLSVYGPLQSEDYVKHIMTSPWSVPSKNIGGLTWVLNQVRRGMRQCLLHLFQAKHQACCLLALGLMAIMTRLTVITYHDLHLLALWVVLICNASVMSSQY